MSMRITCPQGLVERMVTVLGIQQQSLWAYKFHRYLLIVSYYQLNCTSTEASAPLVLLVRLVVLQRMCSISTGVLISRTELDLAKTPSQELSSEETHVLFEFTFVLSMPFFYLIVSNII